MRKKPIKWRETFVEYLFNKKLRSKIHRKNNNNKGELALDQIELCAEMGGS